MGDDVDRIELPDAAQGLRDLRDRGFPRVKHHSADIGAQAAKQARQIIDIRIDEGQFPGRVVRRVHDCLLR